MSKRTAEIIIGVSTALLTAFVAIVTTIGPDWQNIAIPCATAGTGLVAEVCELLTKTDK